MGFPRTAVHRVFSPLPNANLSSITIPRIKIIESWFYYRFYSAPKHSLNLKLEHPIKASRIPLFLRRAPIPWQNDSRLQAVIEISRIYIHRRMFSESATREEGKQKSPKKSVVGSVSLRSRTRSVRFFYAPGTKITRPEKMLYHLPNPFA